MNSAALSVMVLSRSRPFGGRDCVERWRLAEIDRGWPGAAAEGLAIEVNRSHEVSILIAVVGRERGDPPRWKVSMTIMRPPQHGTWRVPRSDGDENAVSARNSRAPLISLSNSLGGSGSGGGQLHGID